MHGDAVHDDHDDEADEAETKGDGGDDGVASRGIGEGGAPAREPPDGSAFLMLSACKVHLSM